MGAGQYRYLDAYRSLGLDIDLPEKGVEYGIQQVYNRMSTGQLKVFASCEQWFDEFRLYRRNEDGRIVKENDHLMDCTRCGVVSAIQRSDTKPADQATREDDSFYRDRPYRQHWMAI